MASVPEPRTDSGERPNTGPGALCFCGCGETIPERKAGAKRRTRKSAEFIDDSHRMTYHRGGSKVSQEKSKRRHVVSYPGEHSSVDRAARRRAQSIRSLRETGQPSVSELIAAWYRQNVGAEVVALPTEVELPKSERSCALLVAA
jgi:hypothetical protein